MYLRRVVNVLYIPPYSLVEHAIMPQTHARYDAMSILVHPPTAEVSGYMPGIYEYRTYVVHILEVCSDCACVPLFWIPGTLYPVPGVLHLL